MFAIYVAIDQVMSVLFVAPRLYLLCLLDNILLLLFLLILIPQTFVFMLYDDTSITSTHHFSIISTSNSI